MKAKQVEQPTKCVNQYSALLLTRLCLSTLSANCYIKAIAAAQAKWGSAGIKYIYQSYILHFCYAHVCFTLSCIY